MSKPENERERESGGERESGRERGYGERESVKVGMGGVVGEWACVELYIYVHRTAS